MAYKPTSWKNGDIITEDKLNNIEDGISNASKFTDKVQISNGGDKVTISQDVEFLGTVNFTNGTVHDVGDPSKANDVANKDYVDKLISVKMVSATFSSPNYTVDFSCPGVTSATASQAIYLSASKNSGEQFAKYGVYIKKRSADNLQFGLANTPDDSGSVTIDMYVTLITIR